MDRQHIPTESPGPLSADFGPLLHQSVTKKFNSRGLETPRPPEGGNQPNHLYFLPAIYTLAQIRDRIRTDNPLPVAQGSRSYLWDRPKSPYDDNDNVGDNLDNVGNGLDGVEDYDGSHVSGVRPIFPWVAPPLRMCVARKLDCLPPLEIVRDHYACPLRGRRLDCRGSTALRPFL